MHCMSPEDPKYPEYLDTLARAEDCVKAKDVPGCCRTLLPIVEEYTAKTATLPLEVSLLIAQCIEIDADALGFGPATA
jgi:hypothetical protein